MTDSGIKEVEDGFEVGYDSPSHSVAYHLGGNLVVTGTVSDSGGGSSGPTFSIENATLDASGVTTAKTFTFPNNAGTFALLGFAQTWTAAQSFTKTDFLLKGTSSGSTTLNSGLTGSGSNTLALPITSSDTLAAIGTEQVWSARQSFSNSASIDYVLQCIVTTPGATGSYRAFWVEATTTAASMAASVFGIRGKATLGAGSTSSGTSYIVGIQGRIDIAGTLGDSTWTAALYGQVGNTNPTLITGGRMHGLWIQNDFTAYTSGVTAGGFSLVLLASNATAVIDSVFEIASVKATYLFDLDDGSAGTWLQPLTTLTGGIIGRIKVRAPGQDYYIPLYES